MRAFLETSRLKTKQEVKTLSVPCYLENQGSNLPTGPNFMFFVFVHVHICTKYTVRPYILFGSETRKTSCMAGSSSPEDTGGDSVA